jgi:hypothetical protein
MSCCSKIISSLFEISIEFRLIEKIIVGLEHLIEYKILMGMLFRLLQFIELKSNILIKGYLTNI